VIPTRGAGLARLADVTPIMGAAYAARRNDDRSPDKHQAVSGLSSWLRYRLVNEEETIAAARSAHGDTRSGKFIQEVL